MLNTPDEVALLAPVLAAGFADSIGAAGAGADANGEGLLNTPDEVALVAPGLAAGFAVSIGATGAGADADGEGLLNTPGEGAASALGLLAGCVGFGAGLLAAAALAAACWTAFADESAAGSTAGTALDSPAA